MAPSVRLGPRGMVYDGVSKGAKMYDAFYGLAARPFQLTPDPSYYFESATHRKALSYLGYGLAQGEGFIVVTGDIGAGKSTLVGYLMQSIDRARMTAATIVTTQLDAYDLVQMAAEAFGIDTSGLDKAASLKSIENFLHAEARTGRRCLLVIDEAQNLSIGALEELRMLSNFQLGSKALLQIFLLGQPEFRDLLRAAPDLEQLRQRVIATHHLDPMDASEVQPYVVHRLTRAGWGGNPTLSPEIYPMLFTQTGGIPRKLNTFMNRVMLMGAVERVHVIDVAIIDAVVADMAEKPFAYEAQMSTRIAHLEETASEANPIERSQPDNNVVEQVTPILAAVSNGYDQICDRLPESSSETQLDADTRALQELALYETDTLEARLVALEQQVIEQNDALRRVLSTMIDWMDKEGSVEARFRQNNRAA